MLTSSAAELDRPPPSGTEETITASNETWGPKTSRYIKCRLCVHMYVKYNIFPNLRPESGWKMTEITNEETMVDKETREYSLT